MFPAEATARHVGDGEPVQGVQLEADGLVDVPCRLVVAPVLPSRAGDAVEDLDLFGERRTQAGLRGGDLFLGGADRVGYPLPKGAFQQHPVHRRRRPRARHGLGKAAPRLGHGALDQDQSAGKGAADARISRRSGIEQVKHRPPAPGDLRGEGDVGVRGLRERVPHAPDRVELLLPVRDQHGAPGLRTLPPQRHAPRDAADPPRHMAARRRQGLRVCGPQEPQQRLPGRKVVKRGHQRLRRSGDRDGGDYGPRHRHPHNNQPPRPRSGQPIRAPPSTGKPPCGPKAEHPSRQVQHPPAN